MHSPTGERLLAVGYCVIADGIFRPIERPIGAPLFRQASVSWSIISPPQRYMTYKAIGNRCASPINEKAYRSYIVRTRYALDRTDEALSAYLRFFTAINHGICRSDNRLLCVSHSPITSLTSRSATLICVNFASTSCANESTCVIIASIRD